MVIIGIDHGNKQIKTAQSIFTSGIEVFDTKPGLPGDCLEYRGKYYIPSKKRIPYHRDKSVSEDFYLLTLLGIAKELEKRGVQNTVRIDVAIAAGLPPTHYGRQQNIFKNYLLRGPEDFIYNGTSYAINIVDASIYPQGYTAVLEHMSYLQRQEKAFLLDIGGYTVIYMTLMNGVPDMSNFDSLEHGVITFYNDVITKVNAGYDVLLQSSDIDDIVMHKNTTRIPLEICNYVLDLAQKYTKELFQLLRERKIELKTTLCVMAGGGSILFQKQIEAIPDLSHTFFVNNIHAGAKGMEQMYAIEHGIML